MSLKKYYKEVVVSKLSKKFEYKNVHQIPKLEKIVINCGLGLAFQNKQTLKRVIEEIRIISGQHPIITKAKKSISTFKIREGMALGLVVTLRRDKMYAFFEKLSKLVLPRVRDFQGLSLNSFDKFNNYTFGITDQYLFPELDNEGNTERHGFDITIVTSAKKKEEAVYLLSELGLIFKKN